MLILFGGPPRAVVADMNQTPDDLQALLREHTSAAIAYQLLDLDKATEYDMDRAADRLDAAAVAIGEYVNRLRAPAAPAPAATEIECDAGIAGGCGACRRCDPDWWAALDAVEV